MKHRDGSKTVTDADGTTRHYDRKGKLVRTTGPTRVTHKGRTEPTRTRRPMSLDDAIRRAGWLRAAGAASANGASLKAFVAELRKVAGQSG